jgi:hypothetical protein
VVALLLTPVSFWQHGTVGVVVVLLAAMVMQLTMAISAWCYAALCHSGRALAAILSAMGTRMVVPLIFAVVLMSWPRPTVPAAAALYIVPLYLAMLLTETLSSVRRIATQEDPYCSSGMHGARGVQRG